VVSTPQVIDTLICTTRLDSVVFDRLSLSLFNFHFFYRYHDPCTHVFKMCRILELYVMAKRYNQAVEMCLDHKVPPSPSLPQYSRDAEYDLITIRVSMLFSSP
jgi:hypothetical protein